MIQEWFLQHPMSMTKGHYLQDLKLIYKKFTNKICEMPTIRYSDGANYNLLILDLQFINPP
jgi:hypothetical protein